MSIWKLTDSNTRIVKEQIQDTESMARVYEFPCVCVAQTNGDSRTQSADYYCALNAPDGKTTSFMDVLYRIVKSYFDGAPGDRLQLLCDLQGVINGELTSKGVDNDENTASNPDV